MVMLNGFLRKWAGLTMIFLTTLSARAEEKEFRAFWVDAYHSGFGNSNEVAELIADVRAAHANAVVVEVRRRGDAYYESRFEPKARGIDAKYDPLADLVAQAHDTKGGARIEVHAWMTVYPVWSGASGYPGATNHPYVLHPGWLSRT